MNTASRIESTGERGRTHVSKATADLLIAAGKSHWVQPRSGGVVAKGKGELETFWLQLGTEGSVGGDTSQTGSTDDTDVDSVAYLLEPMLFNGNTRSMALVDAESLPAKDRRLIDWNVTVLQDRLEAIVAQRTKVQTYEVNLDHQVLAQLHQYVVGIAAMYRRNPFHNFLHASHVTMSVTKMLSRVASSDEEETSSNRYTKGITSDPLTQFAVVFAALIHDVDHPGVPNTRLVEERAPVAAMYKNKSVAENNSIEVGTFPYEASG